MKVGSSAVWLEKYLKNCSEDFYSFLKHKHADNQ